MRSSSSAQIRRQLGRSVADRRRALGLTQEALAEQLGVSTRYVQTVEAGRENLTIDTICKLAGTLRSSFSELVIGVPPKPKLSGTRR